MRDKYRIITREEAKAFLDSDSEEWLVPIKSDLRTELERLVKEWRESAAAAESWPDPASQGEAVGQSKCADDLEAVLRRTAAESNGTGGWGL